MPIKKRKVTYSKGAKTVTKRSGATKKTTISADGRKKTVAKTSKKGATKSRTTNISPDYKSATITRKKNGKVVKERKQKALTPRQAMMMDASRGDFKSTAEKRKKQARKLTNKPAAIEKKKEKKAEKWVKRELKKEDREFYSEQRKIGRDRKKSKRKSDSERASRKRQGHRKNARIENKKKP